ncbi:MAG TPA: hypothetical protein VI855_08025 [Dehalococcoidia bacterium]|nr:hypothetical protein [Dehalococcoidia bacterium]
MTMLAPMDPKEVIRQNLTFLRAYARRVIVEGDDALTPIEDVKDVLAQEFVTLGRSFQLTDRDLALLIFHGIWEQPA